VDHLGARDAVLVPVAGMLSVLLLLVVRSPLWNIRRLLDETPA
jgi:hypothetical protein